MNFKPDYNNVLDAVNNLKPERLPLYEHIISPYIMESILDVKFAEMENSENSDLQEFFRNFCHFFKEMTYDTVSYEICITSILPDSGALYGGKPGPIQSHSDFEKYPWDKLEDMFWSCAEKKFQALSDNIPEGMKAIGGIGNGVFEISEDLVGLEHLAYMQADEPELFFRLYDRIGDLMATIWKRFLGQFSDDFVVCRFGDDLGFRSGTLTSPNNIRKYIIPQYKKVLDPIKKKRMPFL